MWTNILTPYPSWSRPQTSVQQALKIMHSIIYREENAYNKGLFKNVVIKTGEVFAFISTIFISWCCNFTSSSTMHMKFSHILLTNLQKCLENIIFSRRIEPSVFPEISFWFTLQPKMYFFKHFQRLVNKIFVCALWYFE